MTPPLSVYYLPTGIDSITVKVQRLESTIRSPKKPSIPPWECNILKVNCSNSVGELMDQFSRGMTGYILSYIYHLLIH